MAHGWSKREAGAGSQADAGWCCAADMRGRVSRIRGVAGGLLGLIKRKKERKGRRSDWARAREKGTGRQRCSPSQVWN
jgi:hypothetical protein